MKRVLFAVLLLTACVKEMGDQPKIESFEGHPAEAPAGTVAIEETVSVTWPSKPTLEMLHRGQNRYDIYCSVCHGRTGDGDGMVVRRGFPAPPPFTQRADLTREQIYDIETQGLGTMASYRAKLSIEDRRNVALYVKALQLSRNFPAEKVK